MVKKLSIPFLLLIVFFMCIFGFVYSTVFYNLPNPANLKNYKTVPISSQILDRNGNLLYQVYKDQNRIPISLKSLPPYVYQASIAIEDKDFYHHNGVSIFSGVLRAVKEIVINHSLQGGSTITQQLVKSALLTPERTVVRKIREIVLALWTEQIYKKDEILEMYLNQVAYGGDSYGIEQASETYFGKHAKDLTIAEASLLAGLPQAPSNYSPFVNPDLAITRRNEVLQQMKLQGYITAAQEEEARNTPLNITPTKDNLLAPHFVFYVKSILEKEFGEKAVEEDGLKVTTTLDLDIQQQAEQIVKDEVTKDKYLNLTNAAALVTRPPTGEILAMVGSVDYYASPSGAFNVTLANRQPGSSIKPLNYAIGIDRQLVTAATVFIDDQTCFPSVPKPYCPVNYDGKFHGPVQLRFALGNSFNVPAVKMLQMNGVENFVASASAFGIKSFKSADNYGLSLTLGGGEVPMVDMAQAYSTFANRGVSKPLVSILKVEDKAGNVLYQFKDGNYVKDVHQPLQNPDFLVINGKRVISPATAFIISHILLDNNARLQEFGPSSALVVPKHTVSVKTGTTDDKKDNLTTGYTANFLVDVWVGNNDNSPMNQALASGLTGAAPIWNRIMTYILKDQPDLPPIKPANVVSKYVCALTGAPVTKNPDGSDSCPTRFEYFIKGTENMSQFQESKETIPVNKDTGKMTKPDDPNMEMREQTVIKDKNNIYCVDCAH